MLRKLKFGALVITAASMAFSACTDLDEKVEDTLTSDVFPTTPAQFLALSGPVYVNFRGYPGDFFNFSEATTDELVVPTRGGDWADGGNWRNMHFHTWGPNLGPLNDVWGWGFGGVATANRVIETLEAAGDLPGKTQTLAEVKTMRAMFYFTMMDLFGNIPIVTSFSDADPTPANSPRAEVWQFIVDELNTALPDLSDQTGVPTYGRPTQWMAHALLAKLYLNAEVYKGSLTAADLTQAAASLDAIITSNKFALETDFLSQFRADNGPGNRESIFNIPFDGQKARGAMNFQMRTLHYRSRFTFALPADPWNGFCTMAEFFDQYADGDTRKNMWLEGQQFKADGSVLRETDDPTSFPIAFDKELNYSNFDQVAASGNGPGRSAGVRSVKYQPDSRANNGDMNNDFVVFRLADVLLMRAEVVLRGGPGTRGQALEWVNAVRRRASADVWADADLTLENLYVERGRELAWEGWRRNDMIRFGKWESAFGFNPGGTPATRRIFPIPAPRIAVNPNLTQNPGY